MNDAFLAWRTKKDRYPLVRITGVLEGI